METTVPIAIAAAAAFLLALGAVTEDRRSRLRRREAAEPADELPLLHSINDDRCIGCEACVDACPTKVLELVDHKARVIRFSDCVQCEQCANACPTTAMVMYRMGSTPQTLTVPELDDHFQTGIPGQYLIGEVAGKPLVKNAANLGRAVVEHITRDLAQRPPGGAGVVDVAIVGSGPGGLSAGFTCIKNQLSCVVLEKEHVLASTVSRYPKGKLFMAEPVDSGNVSYLPVFDASKEELVAAWQQVVDGSGLDVKLGEAVDTVVRGDDGMFTIKTTVSTYQARAVVLATGLRGKPRLLAVPGANLEKVQSRLDDPDVFAGQHVLVVGGGDSAVEAAMSLAEVGATVTLSYRGDGFKRCKQGNQKRLAEMSDANQLSVLLKSNVSEFTPDAVSIKLADGTSATIPNHQAFVLIGADTPVNWLQTNGVRFIEREHLYALGSTEDTVRRLVPDAVECSKDPSTALAALRGQHAPITRPHRLRSVVGAIGDEFREVFTEVSRVFRISDLDDHGRKRTGAHRTIGRDSTRTGIRAFGKDATKSGTRTGIRAFGKPSTESGTRTAVRAFKDPTQTGIRAFFRRTPPVGVAASPPPRPAPRPVPPTPLPKVRHGDNPFAAERTVRVSQYKDTAPSPTIPTAHDDEITNAIDSAFSDNTTPNGKEFLDGGPTAITPVPQPSSVRRVRPPAASAAGLATRTRDPSAPPPLPPLRKSPSTTYHMHRANRLARGTGGPKKPDQ